MSRNIPEKRSMVSSTKLNGIGDLKKVLISDMEMQSLNIAHQGLVLFWFSISSLCLHTHLCFGMVMYVLCHYLLELVICFLILILLEITVKRLHELLSGGVAHL